VSRARDTRLTLDQSAWLTRISTMGMATALPVSLGQSELTKIASVILRDIKHDTPASGIEFPPAPADYYDCPLDWFTAEEPHADFVPLLLYCLDKIPDFATYFHALAQIHKRRRKYSLILSKQPLPKMIQIAPRALLEFGIIASPALASWMTWRKWFYDIDNRSAQETGYLFEPILASVLGGVSYGSRNSPVRRRGDKAKGRQVDCVVGTVAYEFKLRVTIAASGQGRFSEEIDFAEDCRSSGYVPTLLVLDPTPSSRLSDLKQAFDAVGGRALIGDEAWHHLEAEAGPTMATFVENYVRRPLAEIDQFASDLLDLSITQADNKAELQISLTREGVGTVVTIPRDEDQNLSSTVEDGDT
jgi:hypothetical protein